MGKRKRGSAGAPACSRKAAKHEELRQQQARDTAQSKAMLKFKMHMKRINRLLARLENKGEMEDEGEVGRKRKMTELLLEAASLAQEHGQAKEGIKRLRRALELDPDDWSGCRGLLLQSYLDLGAVGGSCSPISGSIIPEHKAN